MLRVLALQGQGSSLPPLKFYLQKQPRLSPILEQLDQSVGHKLSKLVLEQNPVAMKKTSNAQPAIVACNYAIMEYLRHTRPEFTASFDLIVGHSLGEFTGLLLAGGLELGACLDLVRKRGLFMEATVAEFLRGKKPDDKIQMTSLLFHRSKLQDVLSAVEKPVYLANVNCPGQVAVTGLSRDVDSFVAKLKRTMRIRTAQLPVDIPFHSEILDPVTAQLKEYAATVDLAAELKVPMVVRNHVTDAYHVTYSPRAVLDSAVKSTSCTFSFNSIVSSIGNAEYYGFPESPVLSFVKQVGNYKVETL